MVDILKVTDPGCCGIRRVDQDGCCVACGKDFCDPGTGVEVGDGTRVPNDSLKDAALDLLGALEELASFVASIPDDTFMKGYKDSLLRPANSAIAKAKGE